MIPLIFKEIDFDQHSNLCIKFREDSFVASFGTADPFHDDLGEQKYLAWLKKRIGATYAGFHIWYQDQIVGQMELGKRKPEEAFGYINLYYLIPEMRGKGFSQELDKFAIGYLKGLGLNHAKLSVSPTNDRAIKFYTKNGWKDLGPRTDRPLDLKYPVNYMEKYF